MGFGTKRLWDETALGQFGTNPRIYIVYNHPNTKLPCRIFFRTLRYRINIAPIFSNPFFAKPVFPKAHFSQDRFFWKPFGKMGFGKNVYQPVYIRPNTIVPAEIATIHLDIVYDLLNTKIPVVHLRLIILRSSEHEISRRSCLGISAQYKLTYQREISLESRPGARYRTKVRDRVNSCKRQIGRPGHSILPF